MLVKFGNYPDKIKAWNKRIDGVISEQKDQNTIDMLKTFYISKTEDYFHKIKDGIYYINYDFNAEQEIERLTSYKLKHKYEISKYDGVCDNADQILSKYSDIVTSGLLYCIFMTPVYRKDEPEEYGWRWHKWGEYIGDHNIECEYLYDEVGIDMVYVFSVYEVIPQ